MIPVLDIVFMPQRCVNLSFWHSVFECQMTHLSPPSGSESEENNGVSQRLNTETVFLGTLDRSEG